MSDRLMLKCSVCGSEFELPKNGTIQFKGVLALPVHFKDGTLAEHLGQSDVCPASNQLHQIKTTN